MPGYAFSVTMTITNAENSEQVVSIPRGTIIEPESTHLTAQSAIISKDYIFRLNPKETRSVILEADCWNQHLSPPRGAPGKLTPLMGNIKKTTNVWGKSSSAVSKTISTRPSQNAHIVSAFANTSPDLAFAFLDEAIKNAAMDGVNVNKLARELGAIPHISSIKGREKLCAIAQEPELGPYVKAEQLRGFFLRQGRLTDEHVDALQHLITNVYALTTHRLASRLYAVTMELVELSDDRKISVTDEQRSELAKIMRQKYTTILDSLPLLDEIEWVSQ